MIKLKSLLSESVSSISPKDIFNFYYLFSVASYHSQAMQSDYGKFICDEFLKNFRKKYTILFKKLMYEQLEKYVRRGRIDSDFPKEKMADGVSTLNSSELLTLMKKTFRSDMKRRNDVWIMAGEFLSNLESAQTSKDIFIWIDRLNSTVHNTQTLILGKKSPELVMAYDKVHNAKSINDYVQFVDKDIRDLLDQEVTTEAKKQITISDEDRVNPAFMSGVKDAVKDKNRGEHPRDLEGHSSDYIRGYEVIPRESMWDKVNARLTQWAGEFGKSYGNRK